MHLPRDRLCLSPVLSSVGQCSTASSCLPLPGRRGKHQWSAFASDQHPKGREPRQEVACGLPGNSFAATLVARAPLRSSRGRRAAPREGPRREDVPAREGEGGAASASCEQRAPQAGPAGARGDPPREQTRGDPPKGADAGAEGAAPHAAARESCFKGTVSQALLEDVDL